MNLELQKLKMPMGMYVQIQIRLITSLKNEAKHAK